MRVPEGEGEHTVESFERLGETPPFKRRQHHLCIGGTSVTRYAARFEFLPDICVIVNLAIKHHYESASRRSHGLMPLRR